MFQHQYRDIFPLWANDSQNLPKMLRPDSLSIFSQLLLLCPSVWGRPVQNGWQIFLDRRKNMKNTFTPFVFVNL